RVDDVLLAVKHALVAHLTVPAAVAVRPPDEEGLLVALRLVRGRPFVTKLLVQLDPLSRRLRVNLYALPSVADQVNLVEGLGFIAHGAPRGARAGTIKVLHRESFLVGTEPAIFRVALLDLAAVSAARGVLPFLALTSHHRTMRRGGYLATYGYPTRGCRS